MRNWNLSSLYEGFNDKYYHDFEVLSKKIDDFIKLINQKENLEQIVFLETTLKLQEEISILGRTLGAFISLTNATNITDSTSLSESSKLSNTYRKSTKEEVIFSRYLEHVDLEKLAKQSPLIKKYLFNLTNTKTNSKYLLSEKEEILYAKLSELSSSSWSRIQSLSTSNLEVKCNSKTYTLSQLRNMAYHLDPLVRKQAYKAELKGYESIEDQVALALTNIKREVKLMCELRGYKDPLEKTLLQSKMSKATLDAMISSMQDYKKYFEMYLQAKAKYLGYKKGLPFYELFASCGKLETTYTADSAISLIVKAFNGYSQTLGDYAQKAFDKEWVDFYPAKGKRGGAFCSNLPQIKESRILTNFDGSLSDCLTLAHELGHGYHGEIISKNSPLHWSYPMPLAETASIFCEAIVNKYLLNDITNPAEKLSILENSIQDATQVIIDILSRYLFEQNVFEHATGPISATQMKAMMLDAQEQTYGKGLDPKFKHPYMWLNKGHYYSANLNFYNFPYAFGLLFGKGLFAQYLTKPQVFKKQYDNLLSLTTKASVEDVAFSMGIDVTKKDFWCASLDLIKEDILEVIQLFETCKK